MHMLRLLATALVCAGLLTGCQSGIDNLGPAPRIMTELATTKRLLDLPPPTQLLTVAVYSFADQTGQRKDNPNVAELSTAVTQGGAAVLVDAAFHAGSGSWFKVLERRSLQNLLQERKIIRATREQFGANVPLQPLTFSGVLLEGGIISFDTNRLTGGLGARFLGIGANTEYRAHEVSVYLRAVSVKTGEIVESVRVRKTLFSFKLQSNVFKFVGFEELLEIDAGFSVNEPMHVAVRQAIESAVFALIAKGAINGLWRFADPEAGAATIDLYRQLSSPVVQEGAAHAAAQPSRSDTFDYVEGN